MGHDVTSAESKTSGLPRRQTARQMKSDLELSVFGERNHPLLDGVDRAGAFNGVIDNDFSTTALSRFCQIFVLHFPCVIQCVIRGVPDQIAERPFRHLADQLAL
jgi:hypothetical protein